MCWVHTCSTVVGSELLTSITRIQPLKGALTRASPKIFSCVLPITRGATTGHVTCPTPAEPYNSIDLTRTQVFYCAESVGLGACLVPRHGPPRQSCGCATKSDGVFGWWKACSDHSSPLLLPVDFSTARVAPNLGAAASAWQVVAGNQAFSRCVHGLPCAWVSVWCKLSYCCCTQLRSEKKQPYAPKHLNINMFWNIHKNL